MTTSKTSKGFIGQLTVGSLELQYYCECHSKFVDGGWHRIGVLTLIDPLDGQVMAKFERQYFLAEDATIVDDLKAIAQEGF